MTTAEFGYFVVRAANEYFGSSPNLGVMPIEFNRPYFYVDMVSIALLQHNLYRNKVEFKGKVSPRRMGLG